MKHKARLVAKEYVQRYAPVMRMETVLLLLALAAKNEWQVHYLDVKSAFLKNRASIGGLCDTTKGI